VAAALLPVYSHSRLACKRAGSHRQVTGFSIAKGWPVRLYDILLLLLPRFILDPFQYSCQWNSPPPSATEQPGDSRFPTDRVAKRNNAFTNEEVLGLFLALSALRSGLTPSTRFRQEEPVLSTRRNQGHNSDHSWGRSPLWHSVAEFPLSWLGSGRPPPQQQLESSFDAAGKRLWTVDHEQLAYINKPGVGLGD
jgi:hypothetical protein